MTNKNSSKKSFTRSIVVPGLIIAAALGAFYDFYMNHHPTKPNVSNERSDTSERGYRLTQEGVDASVWQPVQILQKETDNYLLIHSLIEGEHYGKAQRALESFMSQRSQDYRDYKTVIENHAAVSERTSEAVSKTIEDQVEKIEEMLKEENKPQISRNSDKGPI